ncbi:MAG: hypothetical protein ABI540_02545 [Spartobacteria bacterium]
MGASIGVADCRNGMGIAVGDYNRDGWFDYFYTNIRSPLLLRNNGGTLSDVTAAGGLAEAVVPGTGKKRVTCGTIFFDCDLDGDPDLFLVDYGEKAILFRNDTANTTGRRWLIIDLQWGRAAQQSRRHRREDQTDNAGWRGAVLGDTQRR